MNTFGGGGKILFPGLASIGTTGANHASSAEFQQKHGINGVETMGDLRVDGLRKEIEEMTRMAGEFFKVDCLYNSRGEIVDIYAGDPIEEYYAAIPAAQKLYVTKRAVDKDIVIVNANAKANEAGIAFGLGTLGVSRERGGDIVIIDLTTMGQVVHYLYGAFGDSSFGRLNNKAKRPHPFLKRIICYVPARSQLGDTTFGEAEKQIWVNSWKEAINLLKENHGPGTKVSVLVDGTMQFFEIDPNAAYAKNLEKI
jgi:hypothetical protein